jgi:DNA polymerase elongation subunit (family B)
MNATYGAFGTKTNRLANFAAAETITFIGRTSILKCNKFIEDEEIGEVVYNDTDSAMIKINLHKAGIGLDPKKVLEYPDKVASKINSQFPKPMSMEADGIFVAFFLYGPKMYAAIKWDKNSFDIMDYTYEYVMSNVLLYVKGLQLVKRDRFKF